MGRGAGLVLQPILWFFLRNGAVAENVIKHGIALIPLDLAVGAVFGGTWIGCLKLHAKFIGSNKYAELPVNKPLFLGGFLTCASIHSGIGLMLLWGQGANLWGGSGNLERLAFLSILFGLGAFTFFAFFVAQIWATIQDGKARCTPGKAAGFLFIPFYNVFYWNFRALKGFVEDYNNYLKRRGLSLPVLSPDLAMTFSILAIVVSILPLIGDAGRLGILGWPAILIITPIMMWKFADAANALPSVPVRLTGSYYSGRNPN